MKTLKLLLILLSIQSICLAQLTIEDFNGLGKVQRNNKNEISFYRVVDTIKMFHDNVGFFNTILNISQNDEFRLFKKGRSFEEYHQYFDGIPVKSGVFILHRSNDLIKSANGNFIRIRNLNTQPNITKEQALERWCNYLDIPIKDVHTVINELLIVDINEFNESESQSNPHLAYKIRLYTKHISNKSIGFVDAHSGDVVLTEPIALTSSTSTKKHVENNNSLSLVSTLLPPATGTFYTRYSNTQTATTESKNSLYFLEDWTRGNGIETRNIEDSDASDTIGAISFSDNDNSWSEYDNQDYDNAALDVHWALQEVYDFFEDKYSRNGWDSAGQKINSFVHAIIDGYRDNAAYYTGEYLAFGDGQSIFYPVVSLDAVAHEYAHGINDHTSDFGSVGLVRSFNEGLSDIWAAAIEKYVAPQKELWKMCEEIMRNDDCLRNLSDPDDPNADTQMADTYGTTEYNGNSDVYFRSGIMSHWFYLLSEGGTGTNGLGNNYTVYGLGIESAADLVYHAQAERLLNGTSSYPLMRTNMLTAADDLFGENSIQSLQVANAWYAVGVGTQPSQVTYAGPNPNPVCSAGSQYSVNYVPLGCSVSWTASPSNLFTTSSGSGSIFSTAWNGGVRVGYGTVTASITSGGSGIHIPITAWIGKPLSPSSIQYIPEEGVCIGPENVYQVGLTHSYPETVSSWDWDLQPPGIIIGSQTGLSLRFYYPNGTNPNTYSMGVAAINSCGQSGYRTAYFDVIDCGFRGTLSFDLFPNPASDNVQINISTAQDSINTVPANQNISNTYSVSIINMYGTIMHMSNQLSTQFTIPLNGLRDGNYIISISNNSQRGQKILIIKH